MNKFLVLLMSILPALYLPGDTSLRTGEATPVRVDTREVRDAIINRTRQLDADHMLVEYTYRDITSVAVMQLSTNCLAIIAHTPDDWDSMIERDGVIYYVSDRVPYQITLTTMEEAPWTPGRGGIKVRPTLRKLNLAPPASTFSALIAQNGGIASRGLHARHRANRPGTVNISKTGRKRAVGASRRF